MSTRRQRTKDGAVYFGTFTCYRWLPLIHATNAYDTFYNWMHIAHGMGYHFLGYAIMPNHAHFLIRVPEGGAINTMLGNGKRFIAYEIIQRLEKAGRHDLLAQLRDGVRASDSARGQKHRVFDTSTDLIECFSAKMIVQKLRYIHANPVSKKWRLAEDAVEYPHSSFAFYARGDAREAPLTPYQEFGYLGRKGAPW
jgi:REP element-mobilizing transposase RayT